jgi:hypothetical protein
VQENVQETLLGRYVALQSWRATTGERLLDRFVRDESGEGVISAAIAVLIMAFLGAGAWLAFRTMFQHAADSTNEQIGNIGQ